MAQGRAKRAITIAVGLALGAGLIAGALRYLPLVGPARALDALALVAAFDEDLPTALVEQAASIDFSGALSDGPLPDSRWVASRAFADIVRAERAGGRDRALILEARAHLAAQARLSPGNPYLWADLAAVDLALGAGPQRAEALLWQSIRLGRNAVRAWPGRVAVAFSIWPDISDRLRQHMLDEAVALWGKHGDSNWKQSRMQERLVKLALDAGLTDTLTPLIAVTPEDLARWTFLLSAALERA